MLTQLSTPSAEPLSLADAKLHLRVDADITEDDGLIAALIVTARQQAEHRTGRALVSQQWRLGLDQFPDDSLELPKPKLVSVQSVTYLDSNGTRQTLAGGDYEVITDDLVGRLVPAFGKSWPACRLFPGSVQVSYTCGYGAAAAIRLERLVYMQAARFTEPEAVAELVKAGRLFMAEQEVPGVVAGH